MTQATLNSQENLASQRYEGTLYNASRKYLHEVRALMLALAAQTSIQTLGLLFNGLMTSFLAWVGPVCTCDAFLRPSAVGAGVDILADIDHQALITN